MKQRRSELIIRQWKPHNIDGIRLLTTSYQLHQFPNHFHDYYSFLSVRKGVNEGFTEKTPYRFGTGAVLTIGPGQVHAGNSYQKKPLIFDVLHVEDKALQEWSFRNNITPSTYEFSRAPFTSAKAYKLFEQLSAAIRLKESTLQIELLFDQFISTMVSGDATHCPTERDSCKRGTKPYVARSIEYLHAHYDQDITLQELSAAACVSPHHLIRQFHKQLGLTPFQYLRNYRVDQARKQLIDNSNLASISASVGFYDESHFIRNFYQILGVSPSSYRKALS
ncbi:MAG: AraC family transcriptional regulator [Cyclobacteriaceae bacterium]